MGSLAGHKALDNKCRPVYRLSTSVIWQMWFSFFTLFRR